MKTEIQIDVSQISAAEMQPLCRTILAAVEEFYRDQKNVEFFNKWKTKHQREKQKNQ